MLWPAPAVPRRRAPEELVAQFDGDPNVFSMSGDTNPLASDVIPVLQVHPSRTEMLNNDKAGLKRLVEAMLQWEPTAYVLGNVPWQLSEFLVNAEFPEEIFRFSEPAVRENESQMELVQRFGSGTPGLLRGFIPSRYRSWGLYRWPLRLFAADEVIHYRWWRQTPNSLWVAGDRHSFRLPRSLTLVAFGDSFGSGEGAPNRSNAVYGPPWLDQDPHRSHPRFPYDVDNPHRSIHSGFESAVREFTTQYPDWSVEYQNEMYTGAQIGIKSLAEDGSLILLGTRNLDSGDDELNEERSFATDGPLLDADSEILFHKDFPVQFKRFEDTNLLDVDHRFVDQVFMSFGGNDISVFSLLKNYLLYGTSSDSCIYDQIDATEDTFDFSEHTNPTGMEFLFDGYGDRASYSSYWGPRLVQRLHAAAEFLNSLDGSQLPQHDILNGTESANDTFDQHYSVRRIYQTEWYAYPNLMGGFIDDDSTFPLYTEQHSPKMITNAFLREPRLERVVQQGVSETFNGLLGPAFFGFAVSYGVLVDIACGDESFSQILGKLGTDWTEIQDIRNNFFPTLAHDQRQTLSLFPNVRFNERAFQESNRAPTKIAVGYPQDSSWFNQISFYSRSVERDIMAAMSGSVHPNYRGYQAAYLPAYRQTLREQVAAPILHLRAVEEGYDETFLQIADLKHEHGQVHWGGTEAAPRIVLAFTLLNDRKAAAALGGVKVRAHVYRTPLQSTDAALTGQGAYYRATGAKRLWTQSESTHDLSSSTGNSRPPPVSVIHSIPIPNGANALSSFHPLLGLARQPGVGGNPMPVGTSLNQLIQGKFGALWTVVTELDADRDVLETNEANNTFTMQVTTGVTGDKLTEINAALRDELQQNNAYAVLLEEKYDLESVLSNPDELKAMLYEGLDGPWANQAAAALGMRLPQSDLETRSFTDGQSHGVEPLMTLSAFARAMRDGSPIVMAESAHAPMVDPRLALDQLSLDHFESQQAMDLADFSDAFDNLVYPSNFMDVLYRKHVGESAFDGAFETYRISIDMTDYVPMLSDYDQEQQNLYLQLFPERFDLDLSGLPLSVKLGFQDLALEQWHTVSLEIALNNEPGEVVVPLAAWLEELGIDGRPLIVDLYATHTDEDGVERSERVAGASVRMQAEIPLLTVPELSSSGQPDDDGLVTLSWEAPSGAQGTWSQVTIGFRAGEELIYDETVDYVKGEVGISAELFDRGLYEYQIDFSVDGKTVSYPFFDHRREEKLLPVIGWKLPVSEWGEGEPIGKEFFPTTASHDGQNIEGTFEYAGAAGEMRGDDRLLLRATFIPADLDQYEIAVAFRTLEIKTSVPMNGPARMVLMVLLLTLGLAGLGMRRRVR